MSNLIEMGAIAGIGLLALLTIGIVFSRLYKRSTKETAFVRTGLGGQKVIMDGGAIVLIDGKPRRVRLNEVVEGWKLSAVQVRSVTFTRGAQRRELQLVRAKLTDDPAQPAAGAVLAKPPAPAPKP